jgi:precorrin-8X/cobalt-precorrin-8 methylmutase
MNQEFTPITRKPMEIESESFRIIDSEIGEHSFSPLQYPIVRRVIHATADFDLGQSIVFSDKAVENGIAALRSGKPIIADVGMVQSGISKPRIEKFGCEVRMYISREDVVAKAKEEQTTRAIIATRIALNEAPDGIFVIGNAPTALLEIIRFVKEGKASPSLVIGMPVGFVSAQESKQELEKINIPFITNRGRKGGTPAAVAATNALSILADNPEILV